MADEIDLANEAAARFIEQSYANRATGPKLTPNGACHNCETVFESHHVNEEGIDVDESGTPIALKLFCDRECADEHAHYMRLKSMNS